MGFYNLYAHIWQNLSSLGGQNKLLMDSAFTCKWSKVAGRDLGSFSEQMLRMPRSIAATSIYSAQMLISHNVSFDDGSVCRLFNQS